MDHNKEDEEVTAVIVGLNVFENAIQKLKDWSTSEAHPGVSIEERNIKMSKPSNHPTLQQLQINIAHFRFIHLFLLIN